MSTPPADPNATATGATPTRPEEVRERTRLIYEGALAMIGRPTYDDNGLTGGYKSDLDDDLIRAAVADAARVLAAVEKVA